MVFIDDTNQTEETQKKWRLRREKEVADRERRVPQGSNRMVGEMFLKFKVPVHYSTEMDNDDTIAEYAAYYNASILSGDRDYFRYNKSFKIYSGYEVGKGYTLELIKQEATSARSCPRSLEGRIPQTNPTMKLFCHSSQNEHLLQRGSPSPLTRDAGNPHGKIKKLRQALYFKLGVKIPVREIYPEWDHENNRTVWVNEQVYADPTCLALLQDPKKAHDVFFGNELKVPITTVKPEEWLNHVTSTKIVTYELCALANQAFLLDYLQTY